MSKKNNAKRVAYQKKQEQKGKNVVNWIFGLLIAAAVVFIISIYYMMN
ncbi:MAG: hypothetical protein IJ196_00770 [Prevotella sp.]|nr:hypothetical protein [Prevotella sp.]